MRWHATAFVALSFLVGIAFADQEQATATFPTELSGVPTNEGLSERCIEIAETAAQRSLGYMFRTDILPSDGMLFVFDPPRPVAMWMKNTPTSLDMLFIEPDGTVAKIAPNTEPFSTEVIAAEAGLITVAPAPFQTGSYALLLDGVAPVPLPAAAWMFLVGAAGLGAARRRARG